MAEKNEDVTLDSVFKGLADELKAAVTSAASEEEPKAELTPEQKAEAEAKAKLEADEKAAAEKKAEEEASSEDGDEIDAVSRKDLDAVIEKIAAFEKLLTDEDGDFRQSLKTLVETAAAHSEAIEKALDRLEKLEGNTAVSKSIEGDDSGGDDKGSPEEIAQKGLSARVTHIAKHPSGAPVN